MSRSINLQTSVTKPQSGPPKLAGPWLQRKRLPASLKWAVSSVSKPLSPLGGPFPYNLDTQLPNPKNKTFIENSHDHCQKPMSCWILYFANAIGVSLLHYRKLSKSQCIGPNRNSCLLLWNELFHRSDGRADGPKLAKPRFQRKCFPLLWNEPFHQSPNIRLQTSIWTSKTG